MKGIGGINFTMFMESTPPPGSKGGLINAMVGSLLMMFFATLIGTPIGILAGTYLSEYQNDSILVQITKFLNDVLLSAPSIIIGLFVYSVYVAQVGHFSGWAGALALAIILLPVVVRTTDDMLKLVPNSLREAAFALGAPQCESCSFQCFVQAALKAKIVVMRHRTVFRTCVFSSMRNIWCLALEQNSQGKLFEELASG